jgi:hypothetical protein
MIYFFLIGPPFEDLVSFLGFAEVAFPCGLATFCKDPLELWLLAEGVPTIPGGGVGFE